MREDLGSLRGEKNRVKITGTVRMGRRERMERYRYQGRGAGGRIFLRSAGNRATPNKESIEKFRGRGARRIAVILTRSLGCVREGGGIVLPPPRASNFPPFKP
jgi:hypothetical protein